MATTTPTSTGGTPIDDPTFGELVYTSQDPALFGFVVSGLSGALLVGAGAAKVYGTNPGLFWLCLAFGGLLLPFGLVFLLSSMTRHRFYERGLEVVRCKSVRQRVPYASLTSVTYKAVRTTHVVVVVPVASSSDGALSLEWIADGCPQRVRVREGGVSKGGAPIETVALLASGPLAQRAMAHFDTSDEDVPGMPLRLSRVGVWMKEGLIGSRAVQIPWPEVDTASIAAGFLTIRAKKPRRASITTYSWSANFLPMLILLRRILPGL